jgi:hypothetical protein
MPRDDESLTRSCEVGRIRSTARRRRFLDLGCKWIPRPWIEPELAGRGARRKPQVILAHALRGEEEGGRTARLNIERRVALCVITWRPRFASRWANSNRLGNSSILRGRGMVLQDQTGTSESPRRTLQHFARQGKLCWVFGRTATTWPREKERELQGRDTIICASFLLIQQPREGRYRLSYVPRWQQLPLRRARTLRSRLQRRYSIAEDEQQEVPAKVTQEALTLQAWSFWFGRRRLFPADRGVAIPSRGAMRLWRIEQSNRWRLQKIAASGMHRMRPDTLNLLSRANMEVH